MTSLNLTQDAIRSLHKFLRRVVTGATHLREMTPMAPNHAEGRSGCALGDVMEGEIQGLSGSMNSKENRKEPPLSSEQ